MCLPRLLLGFFVALESSSIASLKGGLNAAGEGFDVKGSWENGEGACIIEILQANQMNG